MEHDIGRLAEAATFVQPGELHGAYRSYQEKLEGARNHEHEERIPWPMLIDDFGRHRAARVRWASVLSP